VQIALGFNIEKKEDSLNEDPDLFKSLLVSIVMSYIQSLIFKPNFHVIKQSFQVHISPQNLWWVYLVALGNSFFGVMHLKVRRRSLAGAMFHKNILVW
jgi:H+/Cl- antiporter ClcA